MCPQYSKEVMDHFTNPRNVGEMPDASGIGQVGNPTCGDLLWVYIRVENDVMTDVKFKTFGCGAAIATSSMVTELAKGKTLDPQGRGREPGGTAAAEDALLQPGGRRAARGHPRLPEKAGAGAAAAARCQAAARGPRLRGGRAGPYPDRG